MSPPNSPRVQAFFDEATNTVSYVVMDPNSKACAIVDSVLDFDYASGHTDTRSADAIVAYVKAHGLDVDWLLESHVHADHLSAAPYLQQQVGGKIGIGDQITVVQDTFGKVFNAGTEFQRDGSQFDRLFKEGDRFEIGGLSGRVMHTPGHTPACLTYVIEGAGARGICLGNHGGRATRAECACRRWQKHRGFRFDAQCARCKPWNAAADRAVDSGEYAGRKNARA